jgi:hypothetical protein
LKFCIPSDEAHSSLQLENRRFTYKELERVTNNFQDVIGRGGFGNVYNGFLEDGIRVAVKLRSELSKQGVEEFVTEVSKHSFFFTHNSCFYIEIGITKLQCVGV